MKTNPKRVEKRLKEVIAAWESVRPAKTFAGMTLEQFKTAVQPSFAARDKVTELENQIQAMRTERTAADDESFNIIERVVGGVKADPDESGDGGLYRAMGYVPRSARRSGLTRRSTLSAIAAASAAAPLSPAAK
jgi:hypothetical protein